MSGRRSRNETPHVALGSPAEFAFLFVTLQLEFSCFTRHAAVLPDVGPVVLDTLGEHDEAKRF